MHLLLLMLLLMQLMLVQSMQVLMVVRERWRWRRQKWTCGNVRHPLSAAAVCVLFVVRLQQILVLLL